MATFLLELVTPERVLLSARVRSVRAPGIEGSFGVLAGHAPFMTALTVGLIKVEHENGDLEYIATSGGFLEVSPQKVIILADTAERAEDIDIARAEAAVARAREQLASGAAVDYEEARKALARALNRLNVLQMQNEAKRP
ncbi:MAG TPA: F0F1 ATP synthase subunit epsilon [Chthonomonadales bacterium]|nr:F0F1 ATP synthase subunit epsilon [Chthonomonadales bacterium]